MAHKRLLGPRGGVFFWEKSLMRLFYADGAGDDRGRKSLDTDPLTDEFRGAGVGEGSV